MQKLKQSGLLFSSVAGATLLFSACSKQPASTPTTDTTTTTTTNVVADTSTPAATAMASAMPSGVLVGGAMMTPDKNIVQNAVNASNVTTLVTAVKAAGLVDTLSGAGPFTVFAPTNDAFNKLPAGTVASLVKPESKAKLTKILTYHVVSGRYTANDLTDGQQLKTVEGEMLTIKKNGNQIMVNGATVQTADVISSNGVTFVIDTVLMPGASPMMMKK